MRDFLIWGLKCDEYKTSQTLSSESDYWYFIKGNVDTSNQTGDNYKKKHYFH